MKSRAIYVNKKIYTTSSMLLAETCLYVFAEYYGVMTRRPKSRCVDVGPQQSSHSTRIPLVVCRRIIDSLLPNCFRSIRKYPGLETPRPWNASVAALPSGRCTLNALELCWPPLTVFHHVLEVNESHAPDLIPTAGREACPERKSKKSRPSCKRKSLNTRRGDFDTVLLHPPP